MFFYAVKNKIPLIRVIGNLNRVFSVHAIKDDCSQTKEQIGYKSSDGHGATSGEIMHILAID